MAWIQRTALGIVLAAAAHGNSPVARQAPDGGGPYGLESRLATKAYLNMPPTAGGKIPALLSQTGAFKDVRHLVPIAGLIPYELAIAFWSDGADKSRWIAVPAGKIKFAPTGEWTFPKGTVFVKNFELPIDSADPGATHRLETRVLVCDSTGGVYGVVYKWRADHSDADLLTSSVTEDVPVKNASREVHDQTWYYPSRHDCLTCHNAGAGGVLGVKTRQMNHSFTYPSGVTDNELRAWNHIGLFAPSIRDEDIARFARLAPAGDTTRGLEDRARSYLDANCSQCHRPGGTVANFDARYDTPLDKQELIDGPVLIDQGIDRPRVIAPHDIWRSIAFMRVDTDGDIKMPPVARETIDRKGVELLREWIMSLPGRAVLAPPDVSPQGGTYHAPIEVSLSDSEPGADIRYTLDGSVPGTSDPRYEKPFTLSGPAVLRTRAYKEGFTRSIIAQQVFIVGK